MIKAKLLKPLDGRPEGSEVEFNNADFDALERLGAVARLAVEDAPQAPVVPHAPEPVVKQDPQPIENKMEPAPVNKAKVTRRQVAN